MANVGVNMAIIAFFRGQDSDSGSARRFIPRHSVRADPPASLRANPLLFHLASPLLF